MHKLFFYCISKNSYRISIYGEYIADKNNTANVSHNFCKCWTRHFCSIISCNSYLTENIAKLTYPATIKYPMLINNQSLANGIYPENLEISKIKLLWTSISKDHT